MAQATTYSAGTSGGARGLGRRTRIQEYLSSSVGAKQVMAVTGLILWLYILGHITGNLQVFLGRDAFNSYAAFMQGTKPLLWGSRIVVFLSIALHAWAGIRVTRLNREARPHRYAHERATLASTPMSRTMIASGVVLLVFFVFHIQHFTVHGVGNATFAEETLASGETRPDAWLMVYSAFKRPLMVVFYVVGMFFLFAHLAHGTVSLLQSLGWYRAFRSVGVKRACWAVTIAIAVGAMAIPVVIYLGWAPL